MPLVLFRHAYCNPLVPQSVIIRREVFCAAVASSKSADLTLVLLAVQALSSMLEALRQSLDEESEGRKAEAAARAAVQERCSAADERLTKLEWESTQAATSLQRKVCHPSLPHVSMLLTTMQNLTAQQSQSLYSLLANSQLKTSG